VTAVLGEPLIYRERLAGVVALDNEGCGRAFTSEDGVILALFASQAAIAVENARLYEAARRDQREAEIVASVAQKLSASLELDTILQEVVEGAREACGSDFAEIALRESGSGAVVLRYASEAPVAALPRLEIAPGKGVGGQILLTGAPFRTDNYAEDPRITKDYLPRAQGLGAVTELGVPIRIEQTIEGLIFVDNRTPRPFTDRDEATLLRLADQAAVAIRNARLYQEESRRRKILEAVRTMSAELARELDSERLLTLITQRAAELIGVESGILSFWDERRGVFVPTAWLGFGDWVAEQTLPMGHGITGMAGARRQGVIANNYREWPEANPIFWERAGVTAALAEPLLYRDRLLGVLAVSDCGTGRAFTAEDQATLALLIGHAAIAIENSRLYAEVRQSLESLRQAQDELVRSEKLRALGQMSAGVAHDLNNTLAAILGQVELMQMQTSDPDLQESLGILEVAASDGAQVVRRLQGFARQQPAGELTP
jgi:GAF domain-containing protein